MKFRRNLATAEPFYPFLEQNIDLVRLQNKLHNAEPENRVEQQILYAIRFIHIVWARLLRIHVRLQLLPLGTLNLKRIDFCPAGRRGFLKDGFGSSRLFDRLFRTVIVSSMAGITLNARNLFAYHGDNGMIQNFAAAGTPGFNITSC
jgi:hypothetical protein